MPYPKRLVLSAAARHALKNLDAEVKERIEHALFRYAETGEGDVERMSGFPYPKLRVGNYRAILMEDRVTVKVYDLDNRGQVYKRFSRGRR